MYTFLKTSLRHLWQSRLYATINVIGLATGIACTLLAVLYWKDEHGFDDFHKNNPHLYRVTTTLVENKGGAAVTLGGTGQVQGPAFKKAVPQVKSYTRVMGGDIYSDIAASDKSLRLQPLFVDDNFFDVFSFKLLKGDPQKALLDVSSVIVTESTAKKLFNSTDVLGKQLRVDADPSFEKLGKPLVISGVVADPPKNSSFRFDLLFPFSFMRLSFEDDNWLNAYLGTFVVLQPGTDKKLAERQFNQLFQSHAKKQLSEHLQRYGYNPGISYGLQPVPDIHLNPYQRSNGNAEGGIINGSNPAYAYIFMGIALFILSMAAINFINISIAGSFRRSKEVGVRKIAGSSRTSIIFLFLGESAILCLIAFFLSVILMYAVLPIFNNVTGKQLLLSESLDAGLIGSFITVLVVIVLLTGFYPARVLSAFKPSEVLYNKQKLSGRSVLGRGLVVVQFALALFLLIATIVYHGQMDYIRTSDLGYDANGVIRTAISGNRDYKSVVALLKNELAKNPSIKTVSFGNEGNPEDIEVNDHVLKAQYKKIDEQFISTLGIALKTGNNLSASSTGTIKNAVLVNEAFVKEAALQDPLGATIKVNRHYDSAVMIIAGVVKDFHFSSLREPIRPMVMYMDETPDGGIWVKFERKKQKEAMASLEAIYKKLMPGAVYQYNFLDELNGRQYLQEQRWQQVISVATTISFIICCLGLFGLAHLSTIQRTKEVGIRKVLGASVKQLVGLLSVDFLKLVAVAFVIAAPVAWVIMDKWLQDFAYRIHIGPAIFIFAGLLAMLVAFAAVSFQAVKAAIVNPVKSLRTE